MPTLAMTSEVGGRSRTGFGPRFLALSARILLWPVRFYRARKEFAVLAALSDHDLKDIGLTRTDLVNVTALPRDIDPTSMLASVVAERRHPKA